MKHGSVVHVFSMCVKGNHEDRVRGMKMGWE